MTDWPTPGVTRNWGQQLIDAAQERIDAAGGTPADDSITNAKLANMAQATIKGRASGAGTGDPTDLTPAQAITVLDSAGGLSELIRDAIAAALVAGSNITITPNDGADTITIAASTDAEVVRDTIGTALVAGTNVTITVDDAGNTITIASSGSTDPEVVRDTMAAALVAGTNVTITPNDGADTITIAATASGGGAAEAGTTRARVYQSGGNTIAVNNAGGVISSLATTAANNVTVIQAAIDAIDGTYTPGTLTTLGHGGGGTVTLSDQLYEISDTIDVKYGVSLVGECSLDRNGFVASAHSYQGTVLAPTSALASMDVSIAGGATVTRRPVLLLGRTQDAGASQSTTNPHGTHVRGIGIDMRRNTTCQGIVIADTQFVTVENCMIGEATGSGGCAVEVISTIAPDDGAHGTDIRGCFFVNCEKGIVANGSGSTDSLITDCRILQMSSRTIEVGAGGGGGGWQISHCHLTTATSQQTGATECHIFVSGAPCVITGNYFDTTGGYALYVDSPMVVITGNYIKHSGTKIAPIFLDGTGRKSTVTGNTCQGSSSCLALVAVSATTGQDYRPTIVGNVLGDGGNTSIIGIACTSGGSAIAETNAAMTIARDSTANPYIWGNRIVQSAV